MEHHHAIFMGKLTISTGPFSIAFCMFTRGQVPIANGALMLNPSIFLGNIATVKVHIDVENSPWM